MSDEERRDDEVPAGITPPGSDTPSGSGEIPPGPAPGSDDPGSGAGGSPPGSGAPVAAGDQEPPGGSGRPGLPWEVRAEDGPVAAALGTVRMVLLEPGDAFARMRQRGQLGDAIVFLLIFGTLGSFFGLMWQSWTRAALGSTFGADLGQIAAMNSGGVFMLLISPVFVLVVSVIYMAVAHVMLLLFGGAPQPLETTWKVICYGCGAPYLFNLLPICGGLIGAVWGIVVVIVGLREAQEVPGGRAAAAVLVPILLVCACMMLAVLAAISMGMALAGMGG